MSEALKEIGKLIRNQRESNNIDHSTLSKAINKTKSYISRIETGNLETPPSEETLIKIATALNMSDSDKLQILRLAAIEKSPFIIKQELMTISKELHDQEQKIIELEERASRLSSLDSLSSIELIPIPFYKDLLEIDKKDITDYVFFTEDLKKEADLIAFSVSEDNMAPEILPDDCVVIEVKSFPTSDELGVFIIHKVVYICRVKKYSNIYVLKSLNPAYKDIEIDEKDIFCVGKVVSILRKY